MPELPEVETVARGLGELLVGRTFTGVTVHWLRTVAQPPPDVFPAAITGRRVRSVGRRGKYVVITLDRGYLLIHLKMSGRLRVVSAGESLDPHTHTIFDLDDGRQLRFNDTRKFGRVYLVDRLEEVTGHLGPEPLADDLTLDRFRTLLARRSGRLKSLLLNQEFVAGVGNIYADETLFGARLHPLRGADTLSPEEESRLYESMRTVLQRAVDSRGTTLDDTGYVDARGQAGQYQDQLAVYGREGQPCRVCGALVERMVIGGRSCHYCRHCQT